MEVAKLANEFETAWQRERSIPESAPDSVFEAASDEVSKIVERIVDLPASLEAIKLKAKAYVWTQGAEFSAVEQIEFSGYTEDRLLVCILRDLGSV